jgi:GT2 family glycosyltransferase
MNPLVFIIILNWNGWKDTAECIESCRQLAYPNFHILVVDNGSTDGSEAILRDRFPGIEIIQTGSNLGFAGGNNVGIKYALKAGADFVWLLNNDTTVDPSALTELVRVAESDGEIGMVGSKALRYSQPEILHFAGGRLDLKTGLTRHIGDGEKDRGQYDDATDTEYISGCSLLAKREVIEKIGLMPEGYFLYFEETDWCMRARVAGFSLRMAMKSKIFHKVSASVQNFSPRKLYYLTRNRLYLLQRHSQTVSWLRRAGSDGRRIGSFLLTGRFRTAAMMARGYWHWRRGYMGPLHGLVEIPRGETRPKANEEPS